MHTASKHKVAQSGQQAAWTEKLPTDWLSWATCTCLYIVKIFFTDLYWWHYFWRLTFRVKILDHESRISYDFSLSGCLSLQYWWVVVHIQYVVLKSCCSESYRKFSFHADNFGDWKAQLGSFKVFEKSLNFSFWLHYKPWLTH